MNFKVMKSVARRLAVCIFSLEIQKMKYICYQMD